MNELGGIMMIVWAGFGLKLDRVNETKESLEIYISVPEHSYNFNTDGEEMAGLALAKRFKTALTDMGVKRLTVKCSIRSGEHWTKEMREAAELDMRRTLYKSQY